MTYRVSWEIDIEAASPVEAAQLALALQRDPESTATVFDVQMEGQCPSCHCHAVHRANCPVYKRSEHMDIHHVYKIDLLELPLLGTVKGCQ